MLKRILSMLLALTLVCSLGIGVLPQTAHAHTADEAAPAGSTLYSSAGGCIAEGRQHEYIGEVTRQPTKYQKGTVKFTCSRCGDSFTRDLPAMGTDEERGCKVYTMDGVGPYDSYNHSYGRIIDGVYFAKQTSDTTWEESIRSYNCPETKRPHNVKWHTANPTCTLGDYSYYYCLDCDEMELQEYKPALGHSFITRVTTPATKDTPGVLTHYCTACNESYTEEIPPLTGGYLINVPEGIAPFDTFGRGYGRVAGGTYFAQETSEGQYVSKIDTYPCPENRGQKHSVKLHKANPDCTMGDYDYYYCEYCNEIELLGATEALGHNFLGVIENEPTENTDGLVKFTCLRCDAEQTRTLPATKTEAARGCKVYVMEGIGPYDAYGNSYGRIIGGTYSAEQTGEDLWKERIWEYPCPDSRLGHNVVWHEAAPTCTLSDYSYFECEDCGEIELQGMEPALGHKYTSKVTVQPTETTPGVLTYTCEVCGHTYTEVIQPTAGGCLVNVPDPPADGLYDDFGRCYTRVVGGIYFAKEYREGQYDSVIETYPCPLNNGGAHVIVNHTAMPTCVFSDYDYKTCSLCHETELLAFHAALGHDYKGEVTIQPTETTAGAVALTCQRCDESVVKPLPALGTPESRGCQVYAPEGYGPFDTYGRSYGRIEGGTYYAKQTDDEHFEIKIRTYLCPVTGKTHRLQYHEAEPTCSLSDYNYYRCEICGETELLDYVAPKGHQYTYTVTKEPTETASGERTYRCSVCGDTYTEAIPPAKNGCLVNVPDPPANGAYDAFGRCYTRVSGGIYFAEQTGENTFQAEIGNTVCSANNGKGHVLASHTATPSCTLSDYDYQYCTLCGETELYALHAALGHDNLGELTTSPTQTVPGVITFTCSRCHLVSTQPVSAMRTPEERGCVTYVPEGYGPTDKLGHSYGRVIRGTYFAETNDEGVLVPKIDTYSCPVSGGKHNLVTYSAEPTCTLGDYNRKTCSHCGETELYEYVPALGHTGESVILTPATAGKEGLLQYTCTRCNKQGTEAIPALELPTESAAHRDSKATPYASRNISSEDMESLGQVPTSYLYQRVDGNLCRVEFTGSALQVEIYTPEFKLMSTTTVPMELKTFCGFYAGASYNFVVYGQENQTESNTTEVYRVVKYSKDWTRISAASLMGEHTAVPGGVRMAEYNGYLYVRGSHTTYTGANGRRSTANVTFVIQQFTMTTVDSFSGPSNSLAGTFEDSLAQFIGVDSQGHLVTGDLSAGANRGILLNYFLQQAGGSKLYPEDLSHCVNTINLLTLAGQAGDRNTGASLGGIGISATTYFAVGNVNSQSSQSTGDARNIAVITMPSADAGSNSPAIKPIYLTNYAASSLQSASTPQLVKFSDDLYLVLWEIKNAKGDGSRPYGTGSGSGTIGYAFLDGRGSVKGTVQTMPGYLSDCQPIVVNGKAVWYVTGSAGDKSEPIFYSLDQNGILNATPWGHADPYFQDTPENQWYFPYVERAHEEGAVDGAPGPNGAMIYLPKQNVMLADFSGLLVKAFYAEEQGPGPVNPWYAEMVSIMQKHGMYVGLDTMQPTDTLNRYNMAVILYNFLVDHKVAMPTEEQLTAARAAIQDWKDIPDRFQQAVSVCYALGLIEGTNLGDFAGTYTMDRAQMATMYCRLSDLMSAQTPAA